MTKFWIKKQRKIALSLGIFLISTPFISIAAQCAGSNNNTNQGPDNNSNEANNNQNQPSNGNSTNEKDSTVSFGLSEDYFSNFSKDFDTKIITTTFTDIYTGEVTTSKKSFWEYYKAIDATVVDVTDGDTVTVMLDDLDKANEQAGSRVFDQVKVKIRVQTIDTPEAYVTEEFRSSRNNVNEEASPEKLEEIFSFDENNTEAKSGKSKRQILTENRIERAFSHFDSAFSQKLLQGKKVRIISSNWNNTSYERRVASILFKDETTNEWKLFSIEMLKNGYTLPRIDSSSFKFYVKDKNEENPSFLTLAMPYLANAYNYAIYNQKGFYSEEFFNEINEYLKNKYGMENAVPSRISTPDQLSSYYFEHGNVFADAKEFFLVPGSEQFDKLKKKQNYYKLHGILDIKDIQ